MISLHYISFNHSERLSNPIFNIFSTWNEAKEDIYIWDKVFKNGPSKNCGRQPFKNLKGYGLH